MDFLGALGSAVTGLAGGGFLGALLGIGSKFLQERQRQGWQEKVWKHEKELLELQSQARASETESELQIVREAGSWSALRQSMRMDQSVVGSERLSVWVLNVRSLWRPMLTLVLAGLVLWIWISLTGMLRGEENRSEFSLFRGGGGLAVLHRLLGRVCRLHCRSVVVRRPGALASGDQASVKTAMRNRIVELRNVQAMVR